MRRTSLTLTTCSALALAFVTIGCPPGGDGSVAFTLTPATATISIGGTQQLTVTFTTGTDTITYTSADESIATVDANGLVTGVAEGAVDITATGTDSDAMDTSRITVEDSTNTQVDRITLSDEVGSGPDFTTTVVATLFANDDAFPDVVTVGASTAGIQSGDVAITFNLGEAAMPVVTTVATAVAEHASRVEIADLDNQNGPDIIIADSGDGTPNDTGAIVILLNDGAGNFGLPAKGLLTTGGDFPVDVEPGDIDNDGNIDLLVLAEENLLVAEIHFGNGDGTFQAPSTTALLDSASDLELADMDSDGNLDMLMTLTVGSAGIVQDVGIVHGQGNGTFTGIVRMPTNFAPIVLKVADLTNDGIPDIVTGGLNGEPSVHIGLGARTYADFSIVDQGVGQSLDLSDIDGDGNIDIVGGGAGSVQIHYGDGSGGFADFQPVETNGAYVAHDVADMNDDGSLDLVGSGTLAFFDNGEFVSYTVFTQLQILSK